MDAPTIIVGPPTSHVSRKEAEEKLVANPRFPKNASYTLEAVEGRWIAAISHKQSAPPPAFADGGGAGDTPDGPPSPDEEPKGPPSDDESDLDLPGDKPEGEDGPPKDDGEDKGKGSIEEQVSHLTELLTTVVEALGLGGHHHDESPVPGLDDAPHGEPGLDGPPGGPPAPASGDGKSHTVHERALKPGEAPPGTTPIGAPSFASVSSDHPWHGILGQKKTFTVEEVIGKDAKISAISAELNKLSEGTGYRVAQLVEGTDTAGRRTARALITKI